MNIFGLYLVKNEADIIRLSLEESLRWCDRIFVFDNGSTDATWDIARNFATRDPRVVPFKQDAKPFDDALRAEIFNQYRSEASFGDWWCRLDADEFYVKSGEEMARLFPDQPEALAGPDRDADGIERGEAAEPLGHAIDREERVAHGWLFPPMRARARR